MLLNQAPLQLAPMYAAVSNGGAGDNQFWQNKTLYNQTENQFKIMEYTLLVNQIFDFGVPNQVETKKRWPGATFSLFNVHRLLTDIHASPDKFLDAPANATGFFRHCVATNNSNCVNSANPLSSFLWYDTSPSRGFNVAYSTG